MPEPEAKDKKISQSLFDQEVVGTDAILHSVEVVESYWAEEKARRRRLALIYVIPISLVVIISYFVAAKHFQFFPFVQKPVWMDSVDVPEGGLPDQLVSKTEGNPDALIKIVATLPKGSELDEQVQKVLHEAIDLKPSQFYLQYHLADNLPREERDKLEYYDGYSITVNEQTKFVFGDPKRPDQVIDLLGPCPIYYTANDLLTVINSVYRETYGSEQPPLLDSAALGLEPGEGTEGQGPDPLPIIGVEGVTPGDIKLRLPAIKLEE